MKRVLTTMTLALGLATLATGAHAAFVFDGFGNDQGPIVDTTVASGPIITSGYMAITDTSIASLYRQLTTTLTGGVVGSKIEAQVLGGLFSSSQNAPNATGASTADWRIGPAGLGTADLSAWASQALAVTVAASDIALGAVKFFLVDADGTTISTTISIATPIIFGSPETFTKSFSSFTTTAAGGTAGFDWTMFKSAALTVDGTAIPSLDVSIDIVQAVPEPGSLALLGVALAGVAFVGRRRQS